MPGWHAKTLALQDAGKIQLVGIIQEQHPDRCKLFMQWKQMNWPILVDSLNLLGLKVIPVTQFVDEHGMIQKEKNINTFIETSYPAPSQKTTARSKPDFDKIIKSLKPKSADEWLELGNALYLRGQTDDLDACVKAFKEAVRFNGPPAAHFRLGVALRKRYESKFAETGDFQASIDAWFKALERDPNQYIWRRRIQQYGPKLDKPYPFYSWVEQARKAIVKRGEKPSPLRIEPSGAELANSEKAFKQAQSENKNPDPQGKIARDVEKLISLETCITPATSKKGKMQTARVHLAFTPSKMAKAHWNNLVDPLKVWIDAPANVKLDSQSLSTPNAQAEVSEETRRIEFEVNFPKHVQEPLQLSGYALYYICEDVSGRCLYKRQDFKIELNGMKP